MIARTDIVAFDMRASHLTGALRDANDTSQAMVARKEQLASIDSSIQAIDRALDQLDGLARQTRG
jgi:hypothetical protein